MSARRMREVLGDDLEFVEDSSEDEIVQPTRTQNSFMVGSRESGRESFHS